MTVLSQRELNRATLARQMLLAPERRPIVETVEHLGGLQAQTTHSWYIGLWERIEGFDPAEASALLADRKLLRIAMQRSTIHLLSARDALRWRPLHARAIESPMGTWRAGLAGADWDEVAAAGREILEREPLTAAALGRELAPHWPDADPGSLAHLCRARLALVQVPPRGVWGGKGQAKHTTLESWLRREQAKRPSLAELVRRYLAAFGPASVKDAQLWCGITRLQPVFERLRSKLVTFKAEDGRELFDLPDAPRPGADAEAPLRLLYDYDNLLLSHDDRTRFGVGVKSRVIAGGIVPGVILADGFAAGQWWLRRDGKSVALHIRTPNRPAKPDKAELAAEAERLLAFYVPEATRRSVEFERGS